MDRAALQALSDSLARVHGVSPEMLRRLIQQESGWDPNARSDSGAMGLTQLMPGTARDMGVTDPYDPRQNIGGGARYLAAQRARFGNDAHALAAYNAGPENVEKYGGVPPFPETKEYVGNVLGGEQMEQMNININDLPEDLLRTLAEQVQAAFTGSEKAQEELGVQADTARLGARGAQNQLMGEQAAPVEETNSMADLITRTLGNIADTITGGESGGKSAAGLIAGEKAQILQKRGERLKLLAENADRMADEAAKLGQLEAEFKYRTQAEKATKQAEANITALELHTRKKIAEGQETGANRRAREGDIAAGERAAAGDVAQMERVQAQEHNANLRTAVTQGIASFDPTTGALIPNASPGKRPTMAQWSSLVQRVASDSETRGGGSKDEMLKTRFLRLAPPQGMDRTQYKAWIESLGMFNPNNTKDRMAAKRALDLWFPTAK